MKDYYDLSEREVAERLKRTDENRKDYVRDALGKDVTDVLAYDCVINTTWVSYDEAARMVVGHLQSR